MKERIQMRGHCPACGRQQAANPMMAKHGYTVEHGWFQGTCDGAGEQPIEVSRAYVDEFAAKCRRWADEKDDHALKLEQREVDPDGEWVRYSEWGQKKIKLIPWAELDDKRKPDVRRQLVHQLRQHAKGLRGHADDMQKLADKVHGQPLLEVKIGDESKVIKVGDTIKVWGAEQVVTKIAHATARGCGPYVNGQYIEHVYWERDGKVYGTPKRYVRKVAK